MTNLSRVKTGNHFFARCYTRWSSYWVDHLIAKFTFHNLESELTLAVTESSISSREDELDKQ